MSDLSVGLIAAGLLPIVYNLIPNPLWVRWYWRNRDAPMPTVLAQRVQRVELGIPFVALCLVAVSVGILLNRSEIRISSYVHLESARAVVRGIVAGLVWLALYALLLLPVRSAELFTGRWELRVGWGYWLALSAPAAAIEEGWRAVCLFGIQQVGPGLAIAITSTAFGLAHGLPPLRAISMAVFSIYACWLFLAFGSLGLTVVAHFVFNVGIFAIMRAHAAQPPRSA